MLEHSMPQARCRLLKSLHTRCTVTPACRRREVSRFQKRQPTAQGPTSPDMLVGKVVRRRRRRCCQRGRKPADSAHRFSGQRQWQPPSSTAQPPPRGIQAESRSPPGVFQLSGLAAPSHTAASHAAAHQAFAHIPSPVSVLSRHALRGAALAPHAAEAQSGRTGLHSAEVSVHVSQDSHGKCLLRPQMAVAGALLFITARSRSRRCLHEGRKSSAL